MPSQFSLRVANVMDCCACACCPEPDRGRCTQGGQYEVLLLESGCSLLQEDINYILLENQVP